MEMQSLITSIEAAISAKQINNRSLYHQISQSSTSLGDESSSNITIWENAFQTDAFDEEQSQLTEQADSELSTQLIKLITDFTAANKHMCSIIKQSGLNITIESDKDDMLRLHFSDHSIHLFYFYSGQY